MATFLVERYWPGVTPAAARSLTAALGRHGVNTLQAIVAEADEVCFWYVEAEGAGAVADAFAAAGVPVDRIAPARTVGPVPSREWRANRACVLE